MLRLERMTISGFKSFSDRTDARFPTGITAVVGPNGCGKSNLGDAINWVLGEQSAKTLRGKSMADVIFSGSERRKPQGMAEVSLHLANDASDLPDDRRNVVITRRLFRSGESEYFLNGARSRLKEIQEILRAEHVGAKTYATIEQGKIDQILNAKPKERRLIIEDAAGISGFKHKRRLAELKLEATQANLLRVQDILGEVTRQINSLKRQAARARRYKRLRDDLRAKERIRFGLRAREMDARLDELRRDETARREEEVAAATRLAGLDAELTAWRAALEEADRLYREAAEALHRLELDIDREEARIRHCRERIADADEAARRAAEESSGLAARVSETDARRDAHRATVEAEAAAVAALGERLGERQAALGTASTRVDETRASLEALRRTVFDSMNRAADLRNRRRTIEEALERGVVTRERLAAERAAAAEDVARLSVESAGLDREAASHRETVERLTGELRTVDTEVDEARGEVARTREALSSAREREQSCAARLATLDDVSTRFAAVSDGVRLLLTAGPARGLKTHGVVADYVEAVRDVEGVAETYLQALLPAVILEDASDAREAAAMLRSEGAGRTTFVCRSQPAGAVAVGTPANGEPPVPAEILADRRVIGRLKDRLSLKTQMNGVVQDRIGDAVLVDSLEAALELHRAYPRADYITPGGEVVYASGLVAAGGAGHGDRGLLAHNRRTAQAREELAEARAAAAAHAVEVERATSRLSTLETRVVELRTVLEEARRRRVELDLRAERSVEDRDRTARRTEVLDEEIAAAEDAAATLAAELERTLGEVADAEAAHAELEGRLETDAAELDRLESERRALGEEAAEMRAGLAAGRQRHEAAEREQQRLDEAAAELRERVEALERERREAAERSAAAAELLARTEEDLSGHLVERERGAADLRTSEREIAERRHDLAGRESEVRELRAALEPLRERVREAEMERTRAESDRRHLDDLAVGELGVTASEAAALAAAELVDVDLVALDAEVAELKDKIEKIGPVNMMAIDEFTELEERHAFLSGQKADLEQAMDSLKESIRKINRQSRERFTEAFEAIRANYKEIFRILFNGGRADLGLEEGEEDVLECGIEILAQPPGKRLGSVQLLSGGEKAMSAIALLFAIFRYQPSPFCLLDEVDAALDEANIGRFTRMLREYARETQFILVTHNKISMESANLLYGVTMEEPGVSRLVSLEVH